MCPKHCNKSTIIGGSNRIINSNNTYNGLKEDIAWYKKIVIASNYPEPYIEQFDTDLRDLIAHLTVFGYKAEQTQEIHSAQKRQMKIKLAYFNMSVFRALI